MVKRTKGTGVEGKILEHTYDSLAGQLRKAGHHEGAAKLALKAAKIAVAGRGMSPVKALSIHELRSQVEHSPSLEIKDAARKELAERDKVYAAQKPADPDHHLKQQKALADEHARQTGVRGGVYHISSSGKKVYE